MRFLNPFLKNKANLALVALILAFFVLWPHTAVQAIPVETIVDVPATTKTVVENVAKAKDKWWQTFAAKLVGTTLRNTINRIAYDAANTIATAGEGQKPLWVVEDLGTYFSNLGDAAAGDFIDSLGSKWQVDLCQPPDPAIKAKIGLGLVQQQRPKSPNCSLSKLASNYASAWEKYSAMKAGDYLKAVQVSFEPGGSDISTAFTLFGRTEEAKIVAKDAAKDEVGIKSGWLDVRNAAGKLRGLPDSQKTALQLAQENQSATLLSTTGDALVDAANIFLNQLAYEGMQRALRELGKGKSTSAPYSYSAVDSLIQYGEKVVSEKLASFIKPKFDVRSDYSVLSDLATCADKANPGPNNCVIDDNFSQAISEKLTVAEALNKGYLHGDWLISDNSKLENTYTLRSANILRKFRIVPVGWEQAIMVAARNNYKVTLSDLVSCYSSTDEYPASDNLKNNTSWCEGLVDPDWVLKAPTGSCLKQGVGSQILSSLQSKTETGLSSVEVTRATEYCADEQTCIKEKNDGSCEVQGYCNEEKRTWNFNTDTCEPVFNTCQSFTNVANSQVVSYLENTLDYGTCNSSNAGCRQYVFGGTYDDTNKQVLWDKKYSIYLNNQAQDCNQKDEGCTKLLRGKPGWNGVNFVMNSDFVSNSVGDSLSSGNLRWPVTGTTASIVNFDGGKALYLEGLTASVYSDSANNILPKGMTVIPGWSYTLSADVYIESGAKVTMSFTEDNLIQETAVSKSWQKLSVSVLTRDYTINDLKFSITGIGGVKMYVRNIQLTPNDSSTGYTSYAAYPAYEKIIPLYLESACYVNPGSDYRLKDGAPAACSTFARKCNRAEAGCDMFTSTKDGFKVAAKAQPADYCKQECAGYDVYIAHESYFYNSSADNLLPAKTKTCSAQSVGCSGFTNLDEISQGGEKQDYYTYIRQCIKPDSSACGDFYSWEGDNATGYQLKAASLKKDGTGDPALVNASLASACTKEIYYLPTSDPRFNPDCREFYNKNGSITYRLLSNTFSCSDNCHPYRLNEKNIDSSLTQVACTGSDKSWDVATNSCYVCKNGGIWSSQYNSCIYNAIPGEGSSCSATEAGCREYNGNGGGNLRLAGTYSFESGTDPFKAISGAVGQSLESTAKDGHSLSYSGGDMEIDAANFAKNGSSYVIKFMAKASAPLTVNAYFENAGGEKTEFNVSDLNKDGTLAIKGNNSWNLYEINSAAITHTINTEKLKIKVSGAIFIDNFVINEVTDRYYLVKGTSQVPDVCYYDIFGKYQGPNYNLGCSLYTDISKTNNYLRSFSELCQDSAAGCEQMIETSNSLSPYGKTINLNDVNKNAPCTAGSTGCINVPGHKITYAVYDPAKACVRDDMACTRFAYSQTTSGSVNTVWVDSYKKNLPDSYDSILCQSSEVGCEEWSYGNDNARSYFKNPGANVCVFKRGAWYKAPVKRCDADDSTKINGAEQSSIICNNDVECGGKKCIIDTNDYLCDTTYLKTIGNGGAAGAITTPSNAAALCESGASGCTEFIDPVSGYMDNIINTANPLTKIKQNSLYIVSGPATLSNFKVSDSGAAGTVRILGADNKLGNLVSSITVPAASSVIFHSGLNTQFNISNNNPSTLIKMAIINYKINDGENIDTRTCNGVINTENGCVLFNTRSRGAGALTFNAYATAEGSAAVACTGNNCSANQVIKVRPDRICSRWLTCTSYIIDPVTKEKTCYAMGECDKLNEKNECGNVIAPTTELRSIDVGTGPTQFWNTLTNRNATGYALLNNYYLGSMKEVGQNTDAHFDFESANVNLSCKRLDGSSQACKWDSSIAKDSLVLEPNNSPTGIDYPAHGKGYLRVLNYYKMSPQPDNSYVNVFGGQDYYINYLVNTKKSTNRAKLIITDEKDNVIVTAVDSTVNGWERKVVKFQVGAVGSGLKQIKIYLTTDLAGSDLTSPQISYVYYDDINIEPVLQVAPDKYVAKDCRLYPGADSLTCLSVNNNVVKDGLYGYCLQYDPNNTNVCLMWYPIDQISPTARINQSSLGYKGKFPLYYCTEVNGEFNLMKKIRAVKVATWSNEKNERDDNCKIKPLADCKNMCGVDNCDKYDFVILRKQGAHDSWSYGEAWCIPKQRTIGNIGTEQKSFDTLSPDTDRCEMNFYEEAWVNFGQGFSYVRGNIDGGTNGFVNLTSFAWADPVPDEANIPIPNIAVYDKNTPPVTSDDLKFVSSSDPDKVYRLTCSRFTQLVDAAGSNMAWTNRVGRNSLFPNDTPNYFISSATENPANINYYKDNLKKIIGVPHTFTGCSKTGTGAACSTVERGVITITKSAGATDPIFVNCNSLYLETYTDSCRCLDVKSSKEICGSDDYVAIGSADLEGNGFDLKSYAVHALYFCIPRQDKLVIKTGSKTLNSPKDFACSVTFQEGSVVNKGLVKDPYVFDPSYYNPNTDVKQSELRAIDETAAALGNTAPDPQAKPILSYGRNREDVPFGSAILPSDYSLTGSPAINLRNQYSDRLRETMLAGRPYGCSFSNGASSLGCSYVGQCNINRNIFCIYTGNTTVDKQGCAAAGGGECVPLWRTPLVTTPTLNDSANVLSKIFVKNYSNYTLNSDTNPVYEGDNTLRFYDSNILGGCPGDSRPTSSPASFCYVRPGIKNMKIQKIESNGSAAGGLYKLSFNSQIDIEQQPLKQIIINWGGSSSDIQTVTNLDNKPDTGISPHEFYHYYLGGTNPIVKVMVMDNWNKYNCSDTGGGNACPW